MASVSQQVIARPTPGLVGRNGLIDRYFYLFLSLLIAAVVVAGFSKTVDQSLLHAAPPRPVLLWLHGAAFSGWVVFYILQSALVRVRKVSVHRTLGWFGAALAALMVVLGFVVSVVMGRFDALVLKAPDPAFLSVTFYDMFAFGTLVGLAILWRSQPEFHRRLLALATCGLLDAGFGRFLFRLQSQRLLPVRGCGDAAWRGAGSAGGQACTQGLSVCAAGAGGGAECGDLFVEEFAGMVDVDVQRDAGDLTSPSIPLTVSRLLSRAPTTTCS